jgi:ATP-dependent helicase HrpB
MTQLPVDALRGELLARLAEGPVVLTSPTGSGKSTQVPRWCPGTTLVIEPRRVACRSLAGRVAELEGCRVGSRVGYHVRDERVASGETRVLFATPGVALRSRGWLEGPGAFDTVVLDELHERSLELDLLLALLCKRRRAGLVLMSATLDGARVAAHVDGAHLHADVRGFPVETRHVADGTLLPDPGGLERRLARALDAARGDPGDVLVFLPGKAEIGAAARALAGRDDLEILELHGGLSMAEQQRAFEPAARRKIVLSTNVAETSVTLPGVGVVIDSGLVRQTRYHQGRGFLTLVPVALDSADQRAGRAGRTGPGVCYRLWSEAANLAPRTLPEIQRESLVPLVLAAAAWGEDPAALPMLDPPRPYALDAAREELASLGALEGAAALSGLGRELFDLPLDPALARLLIEARSGGGLEDAIDLVAALSVNRPLFLSGPRPEPADDLRLAGCDLTALVRAVREGHPDRHRLSPAGLHEARQAASRLRRGHGLPARAARAEGPSGVAGRVDRDELVRTALRADPRCLHVARKRGGELAFSNGGTEIELGRDSAVRDLERVDALVVLGTMALGLGLRDTRIIITCATPVPISWMVKAGLGRDKLGEAMLDRGRVIARVERIYAKRVLETREESPRGEVARAAIARLFARGRVFPAAHEATRERLRALALGRALAARGRDEAAGVGEGEVPSPEDWALSRLEQLGVEDAADLALLSEGDLTAPDVSPPLRRIIEREYPLKVSVGDAKYEVHYDLAKRQATLRLVHGSRSGPPPSQYLPPLGGLRVCVEGPKGAWIVRP